jgi:hypothetical protein
VRKRSSHEHVSRLIGYRDRAFGSGVYRSSFSLDFCVWIWLKNEVYKRKVCVHDELLARISHAAISVKKLRRTGELRTRVAKCMVVDGGIFEHLL